MQSQSTLRPNANLKPGMFRRWNLTFRRGDDGAQNHGQTALVGFGHAGGRLDREKVFERALGRRFNLRGVDLAFFEGCVAFRRDENEGDAGAADGIYDDQALV